jgi:hypothetical protein
MHTPLSVIIPAVAITTAATLKKIDFPFQMRIATYIGVTGHSCSSFSNQLSDFDDVKTHRTNLFFIWRVYNAMKCTRLQSVNSVVLWTRRRSAACEATSEISPNSP